MFEIPDDDDLFSDENLGDILQDVSNHCPGEEKQSPPHTPATSANNVPCLLGSNHMMIPVSSIADGNGEHSGSPKTKKMRVLTDVNCLPATNSVPKSVIEEAAVCQRSGDASYAGPASAPSDGVVPSKRRSQRKFPGPAGILPLAKPSELASIMRKSPGTSPPHIVPEDGSSKPEEEVSSTQTGELFGGAAWQSLVADLQPDADSVLTKFSLRAMLHKASRRLLPKGKVPLMVGVLESIDFQGTDASVVLRDPTGQMAGTLHREAVKDFGMELQTGAALVLRQVSVISPSARTHYLNITAGNIVAIYPAHGDRAPVALSAPLDHGSVQPCQDLVKTYVHAAELELLEAASTAKQAALARLRQRGASAQTSMSPSGGASAGKSAPSSGLFSSSPFQGARNSVSGPFTPHRPQQAPSSMTTPTGTGRFAFTKTSASPQMRTPTPGNTVTSSFSQGSSVHNSCSSQRHQTATTPGPNSSLGQSVQSCVGGSRSWNLSNNQSPNCRLQPPTPCRPNTNQTPNCRLQPPTPCRTHLAPNTNQAPAQTSVSGGHASAQSAGSSLGRSTSLSTPTAPNAVGRAGKTASSVPAPCENSAVTQLPQQSKWSFKRKACDLASQGATQHSDVTPHGEGQGRRQQSTRTGSDSGPQKTEETRWSAAPQLPLTIAPTLSGAIVMETHSAGKGASLMWDEELDDDILSQLSDDF